MQKIHNLHFSLGICPETAPQEGQGFDVILKLDFILFQSQLQWPISLSHSAQGFLAGGQGTTRPCLQGGEMERTRKDHLCLYFCIRLVWSRPLVLQQGFWLPALVLFQEVSRRKSEAAPFGIPVSGRGPGRPAAAEVLLACLPTCLSVPLAERPKRACALELQSLGFKLQLLHGCVIR